MSTLELSVPSFRPGDAFLLKLHLEEVRRGILVPGHRFEPFRDSSVAPADIELLAGDAPLAVRNAAMPAAVASVFHSLLDLAAYPSHFGAETEGVREAMLRLDADTLLRLRVFEIAGFLKLHGLHAGDYLRLSFLDESGRRFAVEPFPSIDIFPDDRRRSMGELRSGFEAAVELLGEPRENRELLRLGVLLAPPHFREKPKASFVDFIVESGYLASGFGPEGSLLWHPAEPSRPAAPAKAAAKRGGRAGSGRAPSTVQVHSGFVPPPLPSTELDRFLHALDLSVDGEEIEAFARDELFHGRPALGALDRCLTGLLGLGYRVDDLERLNELAAELIAEVEAAYDRESDATVAKFRSFLLETYEAFIRWMRETARLGLGDKDFPAKEFSSALGFMQGVAALLPLLNRPDILTAKEIEGFAESKAALEGDFAGLRAWFDRTLEEANSAPARKERAMRRLVFDSAAVRAKERQTDAPRRKKAKKRPASINDFAVHVVIKDIEPPISRTLLIPGNRSLADLHLILQAAFGWTDSHLHVFEIRKVLYGQPSPDDYAPLRDERKIRLDELGLKARNVFTYEYDFGDSWEHKLTIRKVFAADGDMVVLLDGERACPLEDMGGLPGYEDMVRLLETDEDDLDEEERGQLEWAGDWDPDYFDAVAAMERLRGL